MTVFKTVFKIMWKERFQLFLYTGIILIVSLINGATDNTSKEFTDIKPTIYIENKDSGNVVSDGMEKYLYAHAEKFQDATDEENIDNALYYNFLSLKLTIPKGYGESLTSSNEIALEIKTNGKQSSAFENMLIEKYVKALKNYRTYYKDKELVNKVNKLLNDKVKVNMLTNLDTNAMAFSSQYFNFVNYAMIAVCVYIVCIVLADMKEKNISKRNSVSPYGYGKLNRSIFFACSILTIAIWLLYCGLGAYFFKDVMFSVHGIFYSLNLLVFSFVCLSMGLLIGNITSNKQSIGGIINTVALGTSFLCGCFVPLEYMPESVLNVARVLPTYWFVNNNTIISTAEKFDSSIIKSLGMNALIMIFYIIIFVVLINIISKKKTKIG